MIKNTRNDFFALLCDDWKYLKDLKGAKRDPMLCGVYSSHKEAEECAHEINDCTLDHYIVRCKVTIEYEKQQEVKVRKKRGPTKKPRKNGRKRS